MTTITNTAERNKGIVANNYSITKWSEDHAMDCDAAAVAETNDILATVIADLIAQGILKGTVTTA